MRLIHPKIKQSRKEKNPQTSPTEHPDIPPPGKYAALALRTHKTILTEDQIAKPNPKAESQIQNKYQDSEEEKEKLEKFPPSTNKGAFTILPL